ncbi:hypothetical protein NM208_g13598 [Fusarium decemcellulare]|uniref:Uncharacterized protein n=1 Tax=Fusarium decemcellulare TaxID=57161 RepID=A0ACC1RL44_9HYPO|nr:hypothetical protein NM208_g13598 [Fusarium decemcellulare]
MNSQLQLLVNIHTHQAVAFSRLPLFAIRDLPANALLCRYRRPNHQRTNAELSTLPRSFMSSSAMALHLEQLETILAEAPTLTASAISLARRRSNGDPPVSLKAHVSARRLTRPAGRVSSCRVNPPE